MRLLRAIFPGTGTVHVFLQLSARVVPRMPRAWNRRQGKVKEDQAQSLLEAELKYDRELARRADDDKGITTCPTCRGVRLNEFARAVRLQGVTPGDIASLPAVAAAELVKGWQFEREEALIARDVVAEISQRLNFLQRVGLGYLSLDRSATTLSGGETQRIRLASQLGSHLRGVLYVLDEPTIGLASAGQRIAAGHVG